MLIWKRSATLIKFSMKSTSVNVCRKKNQNKSVKFESSYVAFKYSFFGYFIIIQIYEVDID